MAKLIAKTPCAGLLPRTIGTVSLTELTPEPVTLVSLLDGPKKPVSDALKATLGIGFPAPNRTTAKGDARAIWCGRGQAVLIGAACPDLPGAACVDQSDAWAMVQIEGADAVATLSRLTPLDLRDTVFKPGHTARTLLGHMTVGLTRAGADTFEIMAFRSMAGTLVHELSEAAEGLRARSALGD